MKKIQVFTVNLLVIVFIGAQLWPSSVVTASATASFAAVTTMVTTTATAGAITQQPTAPLKKIFTKAAKPDTKKALALAEKYYKLALSKATVEEKTMIAKTIIWKPIFTGKSQNAATATAFSRPSAVLTTYTDLKGLYLALNCAIFALDPTNSLFASNMASAIAAYAEDSVKKPLASMLGKLKTYAEDASVVYDYALSLRLSAQFIGIETLPILMNHGYLFIDMNKPDDAKKYFDTAEKIAPGQLTVREGLAAYYLAKGDKEKAKKLLESAMLPGRNKKLLDSVENISEERAPTATIEDSLSEIEGKLVKLNEVPVVLATDFYKDLDPKAAADAKKFVDNLRTSIKFSAPNFDYLTQYSTIEAITSGSGQSAFEAFVGEFKNYAKKYAKESVAYNNSTLGNMGVDIKFGFDINDVIQNPEKYENVDLAGLTDITGLEELMKNAQDLANAGKDAAASGNFNDILKQVAKVSPEFAIFQMNAQDYVNPSDLYTQKYNMSVLLNKINAYKAYSMKLHGEISTVFNEDIKKLSEQLSNHRDQMEKELAEIEKIHEESHKESSSSEGGDQLYNEGQCDTCIVLVHKVHINHHNAMNNIARTVFGDSSNYISTKYKKTKPMIENMYKELMKNAMLISDPKIRKQKDNEVNTLVYGEIVHMATSIGTGFSMNPSEYPYECSCDEAQVAAAEERLREAEAEKDAQKTAMENMARKSFESGVIPESSALYKKLDSYSTSYNLLFMTAKWHPLKTEVNFNVKVPFTEVGTNLKISQNHVKNTTTYGGGLSVAVSGDKLNGMVGASAGVSLDGEVTVDGNGNVVGADVAASASGTVTAGWLEGSAKYEASVMRGCKFSAEVNKVYNESVMKVPDEMAPFMPEKPKKTLWQGEYTVN